VFDSATGLLKFGTRYYDSSLGRWTQRDSIAGSIADPGNLNRYVYAGDSPTNLTDVTGMDPLTDVIDCALLLVGGQPRSQALRASPRCCPKWLTSSRIGPVESGATLVERCRCKAAAGEQMCAYKRRTNGDPRVHDPSGTASGPWRVRWPNS
jgi:RHS repeat-associated protein